MHLVIYFCGTGERGETFAHKQQYIDEKPNIKTIMVEGCQNPEVCGTIQFPDLKAFAQRFTKKVFTPYGDELALNQDVRTVGIQQHHVNEIREGGIQEVESITLCGYSRGAVTCFEVAKELNKIAPNIPVDIVANQPVPGNSYQGPGTNAASVADCSNLKNLRNVSIILGAYTGAIYQSSEQKGEGENQIIHRGFFSQIVPKLPRTAQRDLTVIPRESHHQNLKNSPDGSDHMHMQVAKYLHKKGEQVMSQEQVNKQVEMARKTYSNDVSFQPTLFVQPNKLQRLFGLSQEQAYRYIDKLHPTAGLRHGFTFGENEALLDWWNKHDKKASPISTPLTKELVSVLEQTDKNDIESLKKLFTKADQWLLLKANTSSSRYYQVESLRNNLEHLLTKQMDVEPADLAEMNRQNIKETNYFQNHWHIVSKEASLYKTDTTRELDKAFAAHAAAPQSLDEDKKLLNALDTWLDAKKDSSSKRWEDVIAIKEHLTEVIEKGYEKELAQEQDYSSIGLNT